MMVGMHFNAYTLACTSLFIASYFTGIGIYESSWRSDGIGPMIIYIILHQMGFIAGLFQYTDQDSESI
ncbi:hypothetical protein GCM10007885_37900 [Methylobacterium gnaphalii]|nr:hypothetical protein GCM10007885_37900 [Methylobacterium gnaphalii]